LTKAAIIKINIRQTIIKNAKDFEVLEKDKKIYVLSSGKVYQITSNSLTFL